MKIRSSALWNFAGFFFLRDFSVQRTNQADDHFMVTAGDYVAVGFLTLFFVFNPYIIRLRDVLNEIIYFFAGKKRTDLVSAALNGNIYILVPGS